MQSICADELVELARRYRIEPAYEDVAGVRHEVPADSLFRILQILGAPVGHVRDIPDALRAHREAHWRRRVEPVALAWDGAPGDLTVRMPSSEASVHWRGTLHLEQGGIQVLEWDVQAFPPVKTAELGVRRFIERRLPLPAGLPWGCHRLILELGGEACEVLVISAPTRAYAPGPGCDERSWGVFLPLYALHSETSWGAGDFSDLGRLLDWVRDQGGGMVATLPLLAAFLGEPFEPSPYSPASRLFWNEFYLDIAAIPELASCTAARSLLESTGFHSEVEALRRLPLVDYRRQMTLKRRVLEELSRHFFNATSSRREEFNAFLTAHPHVDDYARFRAAGERTRTPWRDWPAAMRDGTLREGDFDEDARRYHLYVQWLAEAQVKGLAEKARQAGPGLYLDVPLGVHRDGYDVWRERASFAVEASGGCPPDLGFPKGQNWGFPPLHPDGIRADGYRHVRAFLEHQARHAGVLRIDHVPVFHRLFWIPEGMEARDGAYVLYPANELYALFNLASHRHRTLLVGEDLGTIPPEVPISMERHTVHHMHVVQYAIRPDPQSALPPAPAASAASLNTHDMPPFAAFLDGQDIEERASLGLLGDQDPCKELELRRALVDALRKFLQASAPSVELTDDLALLRACLDHLAGSGARMVLVNLEDLWLERCSHSQNH